MLCTVHQTHLFCWVCTDILSYIYSITPVFSFSSLMNHPIWWGDGISSCEMSIKKTKTQQKTIKWVSKHTCLPIIYRLFVNLWFDLTNVWAINSFYSLMFSIKQFMSWSSSHHVWPCHFLPLSLFVSVCEKAQVFLTLQGQGPPASLPFGHTHLG